MEFMAIKKIFCKLHFLSSCSCLVRYFLWPFFFVLL